MVKPLESYHLSLAMVMKAADGSTKLLMVELTRCLVALFPSHLVLVQFFGSQTRTKCEGNKAINCKSAVCCL